MTEELKRIEQTAAAEIEAAGNLDELNERRIQLFGRERGALGAILKQIKTLPQHERAAIGERANRLRTKLEALLTKREAELKRDSSESILEREWIDVSHPGRKIARGHLHPITKTLREMETIFASLGFTVVEGPEVETEYYNFDALNIPKNHPARDQWDTFWIQQRRSDVQNQKQTQGQKSKSTKLLLRTHTSPVQVRYMETHNPPLRIIVPGRVYRHDATDAAHDVQFYQLEGLMVDRDVSIAHFKYIIQQFFSRLFGEAMEIRLRPSAYFPFTEPSFEVDMRSKKSTHAKLRDWLEIAGAGLVHPNVFKAAGYVSNASAGRWQGFAFGMGVDRIAMMKYKIPDIRLFHSGDLKFLQQF